MLSLLSEYYTPAEKEGWLVLVEWVRNDGLGGRHAGREKCDGRREGVDSFCSLVTDFSSTYPTYTHTHVKKKPFTHNRAAMRPFVFISFALDCIEKSEVFCLVRWKVVKVVWGRVLVWLLGSRGVLGGGDSGNAATVD
jgi:hypothetical protein